MHRCVLSGHLAQRSVALRPPPDVRAHEHGRAQIKRWSPSKVDILLDTLIEDASARPVGSRGWFPPG
jgi:hypothetical protein